MYYLAHPKFFGWDWKPEIFFNWVFLSIFPKKNNKIKIRINSQSGRKITYFSPYLEKDFSFLDIFFVHFLVFLFGLGKKNFPLLKKFLASGPWKKFFHFVSIKKFFQKKWTFQNYFL
jgi:hypothetical protein